ncbi:hypothetical protein [Spongiimicrobium sp. 3-5]|uniref:hypothetical protein n=1 Tax=Spongiimicrobium sp. 3-5 TaxID=3332596 RepID=UPI00397F9814
MSQDLRKMFEKERKEQKYVLKDGHKGRFLERLEKEIPKQGKSVFFRIRLAASVLVLIGVGVYSYMQYKTNDNTPKIQVVEKNTQLQEDNTISLGDLSPNLKKVENYYVANINLELSQLEVSQDNKALVNSFMDRLAELNAEYQKLNAELNEIGPNDQTITALVKNLQLRLQLLQRLKEKLNELKSSKNEQII